MHVASVTHCQKAIQDQTTSRGFKWRYATAKEMEKTDEDATDQTNVVTMHRLSSFYRGKEFDSGKELTRLQTLNGKKELRLLTDGRTDG